MHLVVTNIPESFRTRDLRNFFSEYVEKGAFTCFHFRHRPQSQLTELRNSNMSPEPQLGSPDTSFSSLSAGSRLNHPKALWRQDSDSSSTSNPQLFIETSSKEEEDIRVVRNTQLDEVAVSESSRTLQNEKEKNDDQNADILSTKRSVADRGGSYLKSHWLTSGLSGLTNLINEKKRKVRTDWKQISYASNSVETTEKNKKYIKSVASLDDAFDFISSESSKRTCCILNIKECYVENFIVKYNKKHWVNSEGEVVPARCLILTVNLQQKDDADMDYKTRGEMDSQSLSMDVPQDLIEFRPPPIMPQGNVGTPTEHFKDLIRTCQLPGTIMIKLGLKFPRGRGKKRFSQVPFNYGTGITKAKQVCNDDETIAFTAAGHLIPSSADFTKIINKPKKKRVSKAPKMELVDEKEDGAEVEEWERYESFHNDVTSQDRTKERLYEKEIELVWEKGGPGLVFYTDAQFWREQEGDFDEQTADEWDVDMSVYYGEGAGDLDAQDSIAMLHSNKLKRGELTQSAFKTAGRYVKDKTKMEKDISSSVKKKRIGPAAPPPIGEFEVHTRGFGRRLLEAQGWQDGQGLGRGAEGLPYALDNEGQHPHNKKGFGYHGEKLQGWGSGSKTTQQQQQPQKFPQRPQQHQKHFISTVFDRPQEVDPPAPPLRTQEPTTLSHRYGHISFTKASES